MEYCNSTKPPTYIVHWDLKELHGCAMSQKLPFNCFEWITDISEFIEDFIKIPMKILI